MTSNRPSLVELSAFTAIARHKSFRAAAGELGMAPSTLSHLMRALEERLEMRLLHRTTRSVAPTEAGTRLLRNLDPVMNGLDDALEDLRLLRESPSGTVRINATEGAASLLLRRIMPDFAERFPGVHLDIVTEGRFVDIVADGFDAGIRLAEAVPQGMIGVSLGDVGRMIAVASPGYLAKHGTPKTPSALAKHRCIAYRLPSGKMYRWEFERRGQTLKVEVEGQLTLDSGPLMVEMATLGMGIAFVHDEVARTGLANGELKMVLADWTPEYPGHRLYFPSRRHLGSGLRALVDLLKEKSRA